MKSLPVLLSAAAVSMFFFACEEKKPQVTANSTPITTNLETTRLGLLVDAYSNTPNATNAASVDEALAAIEGEIAELDQRVATVSGEERTEAKIKADNLRAYRDQERMRYTEAKARAKGEVIKEEAKNLGDEVEQGARRAGEGIKDAAETVREGVENTVDNVKENIP